MAPPKASRLATALTASEPRKVVPHPGENIFNAIKIEGKAQTRDHGAVEGNGFEGRRLGAWTADPTGKLVWGAGIEVMKGSCGCRATPTKAAPVSRPALTFASGAAEVELNGARSRHRGGGR